MSLLEIFIVLLFRCEVTIRSVPKIYYEILSGDSAKINGSN